ncbi:MAG: Hsp70 family protein [Fusobacteriaceae bacterium]
MSNTVVSIGIDLGTTNTLVVVLNRGRMKNLRLGQNLELESVLYVDEDIVTGHIAKQKGIINPKNVIKSSKNFMGDFDKKWKIENYELSPTDVATEILKVVKENVKKKLKLKEEDIIEAVITVPETFNLNQKAETKKAGEKAGLKVKRIITESVAAAIAYGSELDTIEKIFVIDLGNETFDVTLLEINSKEDKYITLATGGDRKLGGDNFENLILIKLIGYIKENLGINWSILEESQNYFELKNQVSYIMERLAEEETSEPIVVDFFIYNREFPKI